jgi:hypothetical protein
VAVLTWDNPRPWDGDQTWDGFYLAGPVGSTTERPYTSVTAYAPGDTVPRPFTTITPNP